VSKKLVIVESPTKARTIAGFLGRGFDVFATMGHIRDLPKSKLGVEIEDDFEPHYVIPAKSKKVVSELKKKAKQEKDIFIATDEDREGEAIGWHILQLLNLPLKGAKRVAFHEITKKAIDEAFQKPRLVNQDLVDAQQARRILDRLVGYHLSPLLWKKIFRGLSAGRVQSAALRLVVEREKERRAFKPQVYFTLDARLANQARDEFQARLAKLGGKKVELKTEKAVLGLTKKLEKEDFIVKNFSTSTKEQNPYPPFTTSTLQQTASFVLHFSVKKTMLVAQSLYEGVEINSRRLGLITYMRTDSPHLDPSAIKQMRDFVAEEYGPNYAASFARQFAAKSKGAQEAHEAIRPTHIDLTPEKIKASLTPDQFKLYHLIWARALSSQMSPMRLSVREAEIKAGEALFFAQGVKVVFDGFARVLPRKMEEKEIPLLKAGEKLKLIKFLPEKHTTEPPAAFSEGTLVKELEKLGIGRPSTYAPTISTLLGRGYVVKEKGRLVPQEVGFLVSDFLVEHFPEIVDYKFTAQMEEELDEIAFGKKEMQPVLKNFFTPFQKKLRETEEKAEKIKDKVLNEKCPLCGGELVIKLGRFGRFIACSNFPKCRYTRRMENDRGGQEKLTEVKCPTCGAPMVVREGRFGKFLGCSRFPECRGMRKIDKISLKQPCPRCKEGELVLKQDRKRKKVFYGCSRYPECQFASWERPLKTPCPTCRGVMIYSDSKGHAVCQDCGYEDKNGEIRS